MHDCVCMYILLFVENLCGPADNALGMQSQKLNNVWKSRLSDW
jgi:hypothetical protein